MKPGLSFLFSFLSLSLAFSSPALGATCDEVQIKAAYTVTYANLNSGRRYTEFVPDLPIVVKGTDCNRNRVIRIAKSLASSVEGATDKNVSITVPKGGTYTIQVGYAIPSSVTATTDINTFQVVNSVMTDQFNNRSRRVNTRNTRETVNAGVFKLNAEPFRGRIVKEDSEHGRVSNLEVRLTEMDSSGDFLLEYSTTTDNGGFFVFPTPRSIIRGHIYQLHFQDEDTSACYTANEAGQHPLRYIYNIVTNRNIRAIRGKSYWIEMIRSESACVF